MPCKRNDLCIRVHRRGELWKVGFGHSCRIHSSHTTLKLMAPRLLNEYCGFEVQDSPERLGAELSSFCSSTNVIRKMSDAGSWTLTCDIRT